MNECPFCGGSSVVLTSAYEECTNCNILISRVPEASYDETYYYTQKFRSPELLCRAELLYEYFEHELANKKGLDFGCNDGVFVVVANRNTSLFSGVDINKSTLSQARKYGGGEFYYPDELKTKFSCVTAFDVIEHFDKLESFFIEIDRYLDSNGILIITTPNKNSKWHKIFKESWHGHGIPQYHRYVFSLPFLRSELIRHGYSIERSFSVPPIEKNRWRLLVISGYRLKKSKLHKLFFLPYALCKFAHGKLFNHGEEDTLCIVARKS